MSIPTSDLTAATAAAAAQTEESTSSAEPVLPSLQRRRQPLVMDELVLPDETISFRNRRYAMLSIEHLGQADKQRALLYWGQITEINNRIADDPENVPKGTEGELHHAYDRFFTVSVPSLPAREKGRMTIGQKRRLFDHFLDFQEECSNLARTAEGRTPEDLKLIEQVSSLLSIGATGSPNSSASTPASDPLIARTPTTA